jgi:hypothetical protein
MIWVPLIMVPDNKPAFFYLDVAYISHMLQEYVPIVLGVSVLRCSKCFHVIFKKSVSCCKLQVFYLDVAYVLHTCFKRMFQLFIYFKRMLHSNVSCFRGVFRVMGHDLGIGGSGTTSQVSAVGACGTTGSCRPGVLILISARVPAARKEKERGRWKKPQAQRQGQGMAR